LTTALLKKFKKNFEFEKYTFEISNVKHRQAVTKLRISAQKLPVETDRYIAMFHTIK
jgi:hypothetical protein